MTEQQNEQKRPLVGVSVLIRKGDRILLEKRDKDPGKGAWKAPGGHMEFGETPYETAIREAEEEVVLVPECRLAAVYALKEVARGSARGATEHEEVGDDDAQRNARQGAAEP